MMRTTQQIPAWLETDQVFGGCYCVASVDETLEILWQEAEELTDEDFFDGYAIGGLFVNEASRQWAFIEICGNESLREDLENEGLTIDEWLSREIVGFKWGRNDGNARISVEYGQLLSADMEIPREFLDLDPEAQIREKGRGNWEAVVFGVPFNLGKTHEGMRNAIWEDGLLEKMEAVKLNRELGLPDNALTGLWWALGYTPDGESFGEKEARAAAAKIRYRHLYTDYDELIASGMAREDARVECMPVAWLRELHSTQRAGPVQAPEVVQSANPDIGVEDEVG